ncbi:aquaporin Z [Nocardioides jiangxiensis]|uniref:Aquaporin Z n=1 Tax=Nocardioides jiangxiensis TaxID=3064524 RepID=A0ABT9AYB9_9ACTN|nr:aquaporin Z [Nocardioides sp. WY-20]MDO7867560.1 aquaporin Z [Nocardioides sp. WY-20]
MPAPRFSPASRWTAEFLGTLVLVLGGCGTAVLAGDKVGYLGVALAFGLTVVAGAYAFGHVSGGHFNPAVTVGLATAGRFRWADVPAYAVSQVLGGSLGALILWVIASGKDGFSTADGFATNGYGDHSPGGYGLLAVAVCEVVLTAVFIRVILGASARAATPGFAGLAIGLTLTLIHLVSIPVSNTSVNPARSLAVAWFNADALGQVWLFVVAPIVGAILGALLYRGEDDVADAVGGLVDEVDDRI